jgi:hypothetical protein
MGKIIDRVREREGRAMERRIERIVSEKTYAYYLENPPLTLRMIEGAEKAESWWKRFAAAIRGEKG